MNSGYKFIHLLDKMGCGKQWDNNVVHVCPTKIISSVMR